MIKEISFGKVDGYGNGRKSCEVTLEFGFRELTPEPYFGVSANLWNSRHTDILRGGQCVDSLAKEYPSLRNNNLYMRIYELWNKYNLVHKSAIPKNVLKEIQEIYDSVEGKETSY